MGTKRVCLVWNMEKGEKCWGKINASIFSITHTVSVYLSCCQASDGTGAAFSRIYCIPTNMAPHWQPQVEKKAEGMRL